MKKPRVFIASKLINNLFFGNLIGPRGFTEVSALDGTVANGKMQTYRGVRSYSYHPCRCAFFPLSCEIE